MESKTNDVVVIGGSHIGPGRASLTALCRSQCVVVTDSPTPKPRKLDHGYDTRLRFYTQARVIRGASGLVLDIIFPRATHRDREWIKQVKHQFIGATCEEWVSFIIEYAQQNRVSFLSASSSVRRRGFQYSR